MSFCVVYTDQCEQMEIGNTIELRNARVNHHQGCMRLVIDKWGLIETEPDREPIQKDSIPDINFSE